MVGKATEKAGGDRSGMGGGDGGESSAMTLVSGVGGRSNPSAYAPGPLE